MEYLIIYVVIGIAFHYYFLHSIVEKVCEDKPYLKEILKYSVRYWITTIVAILGWVFIVAWAQYDKFRHKQLIIEVKKTLKRIGIKVSKLNALSEIAFYRQLEAEFDIEDYEGIDRLFNENPQLALNKVEKLERILDKIVVSDLNTDLEDMMAEAKRKAEEENYGKH